MTRFMPMTASHHIVKNGHVSKDTKVLECPSDAQPADVSRLQLGQFLAPKPYLANRGFLEPGNNIEESGLAGPVGTDDGGNTTAEGVKSHMAKCVQPAKGDSYIIETDARTGLGCGGTGLSQSGQWSVRRGRRMDRLSPWH